MITKLTLSLVNRTITDHKHATKNKGHNPGGVVAFIFSSDWCDVGLAFGALGFALAGLVAQLFLADA